MIAEWRLQAKRCRLAGKVEEADKAEGLAVRFGDTVFVGREMKGGRPRPVRGLYLKPAGRTGPVERQDVIAGAIAVLLGDPSDLGRKIVSTGL
jgi:hypothetical protein